MSVWRSLSTGGSRPSPAEVVREHGPSVYRHLRRIFGPQAELDDLYQMVFVEILRALPGFEGRAQLSTWIRRITWNVAYQEMRAHYRDRRLTELQESQAPGDGADPEEIAGKHQDLTRLYAALEALDPRQRVALVMHDIEGKTLKQVSDELGRPLQTVASQVYAARESVARAVRRMTSSTFAGQGSSGVSGGPKTGVSRRGRGGSA